MFGGASMVGVQADVDVTVRHPIVAGYFDLIPVKVGSNWPMAERQKWMTGLMDAFVLLYKDEKPAS